MNFTIRRQVRDAIAYILGAMGFLHELFLQHADRPFLLTASLALMGFPLVFSGEEKLKENGKHPFSDKEDQE
jgi:hypothetical protein